MILFLSVFHLHRALYWNTWSNSVGFRSPRATATVYNRRNILELGKKGSGMDLERRLFGIWIPAPSANKRGEIKRKAAR